MKDLLGKLQSMSKEELGENIRRHQRDIVLQWRRKQSEDNKRSTGPVVDKRQYRLECISCGQFACTMADIRTIKNAHHIVIDAEFKDRITTDPHPAKRKNIGEGMQKINKLFCGKCGKNRDWGIQMIYKNTVFSVIKIVPFVIKNIEGDTQNTYSKWKDVPLVLQPVEATLDELCDYQAHT